MDRCDPGGDETDLFPRVERFDHDLAVPALQVVPRHLAQVWPLEANGARGRLPPVRLACFDSGQRGSRTRVDENQPTRRKAAGVHADALLKGVLAHGRPARRTPLVLLDRRQCTQQGRRLRIGWRGRSAAWCSGDTSPISGSISGEGGAARHLNWPKTREGHAGGANGRQPDDLIVGGYGGGDVARCAICEARFWPVRACYGHAPCDRKCAMKSGGFVQKRLMWALLLPDFFAAYGPP